VLKVKLMADGVDVAPGLD
jgi:hypothetical protein